MPSILVESVPLQVPPDHKPNMGGGRGDEDLALVGIAYTALESRLQQELASWEVSQLPPGEHTIEVPAPTLFAIMHGEGELEHDGERTPIKTGDLVRVTEAMSLNLRIAVSLHARYSRTDTKRLQRDYRQLLTRVAQLPRSPKVGRFAEIDAPPTLAKRIPEGDTIIYVRSKSSELLPALVPLRREVVRVLEWDLDNIALFSPHIERYRRERELCLAHAAQYPLGAREELFTRRGDTWRRWVADPTGARVEEALGLLFPDADESDQEPPPISRDEADQLVDQVLSTIGYAPGDERTSMEWHKPQQTCRQGRIGTLIVSPRLVLSEKIKRRWGILTCASRSNFPVSAFTEILLPEEIPERGIFLATATEMSGRVFTMWEYRFERRDGRVSLLQKRLTDLGD